MKAAADTQEIGHHFDDEHPDLNRLDWIQASLLESADRLEYWAWVHDRLAAFHEEGAVAGDS